MGNRFAAWFLAALPTDPVGPSGWTARNWIGFAIQVTVFLLAVAGLYWLSRPPRAPGRSLSEPEPEGRDGDGKRESEGPPG
ncbi:MAG: hypothetical protein HY720_01020 [Planctomycetes bacterium]|nr:hypothetical protein [Planctomycetota bacterium]